MAYLTPEEERRHQQAAASAPAASAPAAGPAPSAPAKAAGPAGSGFTNLSAYLGSNAAQGAAMADTLAQRVEKDAGEVRSAADTWAAGQEAAARAGVPAGDVADWRAAGAESQRGYSGPAAVDDTGLAPLRDRATAGQARAQGLTSQAGRAAQLGEVYGAGGTPYGGGARGLDAALAGTYGADRLKAAQGGYAALGEYLGAAGTRAQGALDTARADAAKRQETLRAQYDAGQAAEDVAREEEGLREQQASRRRRRTTGERHAWDSREVP